MHTLINRGQCYTCAKPNLDDGAVLLYYFYNDTGSIMLVYSCCAPHSPRPSTSHHSPSSSPNSPPLCVRVVVMFVDPHMNQHLSATHSAHTLPSAMYESFHGLVDGLEIIVEDVELERCVFEPRCQRGSLRLRRQRGSPRLIGRDHN